MNSEFGHVHYPPSPVGVRHGPKPAFTLVPDDFSDSVEEAPVSRVRWGLVMDKLDLQRVNNGFGVRKIEEMQIFGLKKLSMSTLVDNTVAQASSRIPEIGRV